MAAYIPVPRDLTQVNYSNFFDPHKIEKTDKLITAQDTFSMEHLGESIRYEKEGRSVFDVPMMFEDWGIYLAEQREE